MIGFILLIAVASSPVVLGAQSEQNALRVRLRVVEQSGFDRVDEPVTFGVPLPEGQVSRTGNLLLINDEGESIPASFRVAQYWLSGSIRWLHVHTVITIAANQKRFLTLVQNTERSQVRQDPFPTLRLEQGENSITIVTGPVKLTLSGHTPGIIERVDYSPSGKFGATTQVLRGGNVGNGIQVDGRSHEAVYPGSSRIEILEQSPMRLVVLVRGQFAERRSDKGGPSLGFEARVIAYAGSPRVTMDYTIVNRSGEKAADKVDLEDLSLAFSVPLSRPLVTVGGVDSTVFGELVSEASIFQDHSDHYSIQLNGQTVQEGSGKSPRTVATGWVDLANGSHGVAVSVRDFWQTWPKQIRILTHGKDESVVRLGLYPLVIGQAQELYIGQARSHRITFRFHGGSMDKASLAREMASINRPLRVVCEPQWYCRKTEVYGPIATSKADFGPFAQVTRHYEQIVEDSMDSILTQLHEGRTSQGITRDSYGWMNWGDVFFRTARPDRGRRFDDPEKNLSWSGNYYDYGFAMLLQFMRSGDTRYLETGLRAGAYTADVFVVHYHPDSTLIGACHYCPPRYHAAIDNGEPYISRENNHAKVASVLARWQWLGDWWARQVALEVFNNALTLRGADMKGWTQCRGNGHRLRILWLAYHFTGELKYQDKALQLIDLGVKYVKENPEFDPRVRETQRFMVGIALEGLILHYWDTGDRAILEAVKAVVDHAYSENQLNRYTVNMSMACGFLWEHTGERSYLKALTQLIMTTQATDQAKIFGQRFRSTPWALGYLEDAAKLPHK